MTSYRYFALGWLCLSLTPCAFPQQAGQDPGSLAAFQDALRRDGFDVNVNAAVPGPIYADLAAMYCTDERVPNAAYANKSAPYLQVLPWKSAEEQQSGAGGARSRRP